MHAALAALPGQFEQAIAQEWPALANALAAAGSLFVLGRGPAFAIAHEAALKFKETCGLHAEAYSGAEVLHGPAALVRRGFPIIALIARDAAEPAMAATVARLARQGGMVFASSTASHRRASAAVRRHRTQPRPTRSSSSSRSMPSSSASPASAGLIRTLPPPSAKSPKPCERFALQPSRSPARAFSTAQTWHDDKALLIRG